LIKNQEWKLFDFTRDKRIRTAEILEKLPEKIYNSIGEVIEALGPAAR
jgi:hypothetical protein